MCPRRHQTTPTNKVGDFCLIIILLDCYLKIFSSRKTTKMTTLSATRSVCLEPRRDGLIPSLHIHASASCYGNDLLPRVDPYFSLSHSWLVDNVDDLPFCEEQQPSYPQTEDDICLAKHPIHFSSSQNNLLLLLLLLGFSFPSNTHKHWSSLWE